MESYLHSLSRKTPKSKAVVGGAANEIYTLTLDLVQY
jgi:hypothetical protein